MQIYDTKVNHLTNPLGFRMDRTVFSWKVKDAKGTRQNAARMRIASDTAMQEILYDSGWEKEADSLSFPVKSDLKPRTRYYWTVAVESDAGKQETSDVQWFETAKREEDWVGKWITCDSTEKRHPYLKRKSVRQQEKKLQRRDFTFPGWGFMKRSITESGSETNISHHTAMITTNGCSIRPMM